jgi:dCTP deaminase
MSLLSDKSIRALCVAPDRTFDQSYFEVLLASQNGKGWPMTDVAISDLRAELRRQAWRDTTPEERAAFKPMIAPYHPKLIREVDGLKIISQGQSSYGYDVTLHSELRLFTNAFSRIINPKRVDVEKCTVAMEIHTDPEFGRYVIMPPNSYALGRTVEYFYMPRNVTVVCLGKSTYARVGVAVNVTPIEAGWHGNVVLEFSNNTNSPVMLFVDEGVAQFLFFKGDQECEVSYDDRGGKYQGQTGITHAKV